MEERPSEQIPELIGVHDDVATSSRQTDVSKWLKWSYVVLVVALFIVAVAKLPTSDDTKPQLSVVSEHFSRGVHVGPSAVPWRNVGRGWLVSTWEPHPHQKSVATYLTLVSPSGQIYPLYQLPGLTPQVVDWSVDGQRVLVETSNSNPESLIPARYETIDLRSGIVEGSFKSGRNDQDSAIFATPQGNSIFIKELNDSSVEWLERYSVGGTAQVRYPTGFPGVKSWNETWLESPNGAEVVLGAEGGLAILDLDGKVLSTIPGHQESGCVPEAFWGGNVIVASCETHNNASGGLYLFSSDWPAPRLLATEPSNFGLFEAWRIGGRVLVQMQSCGPPVLGELHGQHVTMLDNPAVSGIVVGTTPTSLNVMVPGGECFGGATVVDRYTPSTNQLVQVIGTEVFGGEATSVVGYQSTQGIGLGGKL